MLPRTGPRRWPRGQRRAARCPGSLPPSSSVRRVRSSAAARIIAWPVAMDPVNITLSISGWEDSAAPSSPQRGIDNVHERRDRQRSVFAGFDHHGVSRAKRRRQLPDRDHHGPVPRPDGSHDAERFVDQFAVLLLIGDEHLRLHRKGGGRAQPGSACSDLECCIGAVDDRLALLARQELGQRVRVCLDGIGGGVECG